MSPHSNHAKLEALFVGRPFTVVRSRPDAIELEFADGGSLLIHGKFTVGAYTDESIVPTEEFSFSPPRKDQA